MPKDNLKKKRALI